MARVTHVIVHVDILEPPAVTDALQAFRSHQFGLRSLTHGEADALWGGQKNPERRLWAAAFKDFDLEAFWRYADAIPWEHPENAQVFVSDEDDPRFQVWGWECGKFVQVIDGGEPD